MSDDNSPPQPENAIAAHPQPRSHFSLPPPEPMNIKTGNPAVNWKYFEEDWNNWATATKLDTESPQIVLAALKRIIGRETREIAENLPITSRNDPKVVLKALRDHFIPKKNVSYERYMFNTTVQGEDTIDNYVNKLRKLAISCEFDDLKDSLIRDRIVVGVTSNVTREKLLEADDPDLEACLKTCRAIERTQQQMKAISGTSETVHRLTKKSMFKPRKWDKPKHTCKFCGQQHERSKCPAFGKKCTNCQKWNHFATVCRSQPSAPSTSREKRYKHHKMKQSHQLEYEAEDETETESDEDSSELEADVFVVNQKKRTKYMVKPELKIPNKQKWSEVTFQIDNGSEVNCLRKQDLMIIDSKPELKATKTKLKAYGDSTILPLGVIDVNIKINGRSKQAEFVVVEDATASLLSGQLSEELGLISVNKALLVNQITAHQQLTKEDIITKYKDVFEGLGHIGNYTIELNENAKPAQDAPRTVPIALRQDLKKRLTEMKNEGIQEKVTEPTDWVNSAVYVKRPNKKLRICLDPRELNKYVKIPKYRMPTLDDITPHLSQVRVFSVCDAKDGFLQIELDNQSSMLTTFHTPFGRYRWKRLPFGISSAPEEFQRRVLKITEGLEGVYAIADDCLIVGQGATLEEATTNHDETFLKFLERCREANFKLNLSKLRFRLDSVKYHGHVLSSEGLLPDADKVEAISKMPRPKDKAETRRLLGMITYLSKFIPQLSEVTQPLREVTKQDTQFPLVQQP